MREYNINKITMNPIQFRVYLLKELLKKIWKNINKKTTIRKKWFEYTSGWSGIGFTIQKSGSDERPHLHLQMIWGQIFIYLSDKYSSEYIEDPKRWGINYNFQSDLVHIIFFYWGNYSKLFTLPTEYQWIRTSVLLKDNTWDHETKGNRKEYYKNEWKDKIYSETFDYTYILKNGNKQNSKATIKVEEREWRRSFLKWTKKFALIRKSIEIDFDTPIGEGVHSYKGGVYGTGYNMLPNETPLQTLRRMEKERKFNR